MRDKDNEHIRERIKDSMMSHEAIHGSDDMKFRCQIPYVAFMCALRGDRPEDFASPKLEDAEIFEDFDGTNFIWTSQDTSCKAMEIQRFLATTSVPGENFPRFISPQSSMASLNDGAWTQLEIEDRLLPTDFIKACFTEQVQDQVIERIRFAEGYGHTGSRTQNLRWHGGPRSIWHW